MLVALVKDLCHTKNGKSLPERGVFPAHRRECVVNTWAKIPVHRRCRVRFSEFLTSRRTVSRHCKVEPDLPNFVFIHKTRKSRLVDGRVHALTVSMRWLFSDRTLFLKRRSLSGESFENPNWSGSNESSIATNSNQLRRTL